jgi:hypothetical protein
MLERWKQYRDVNGQMHWPDRTLVVFCIGGFLALASLPTVLGVTENEEAAFMIGAAVMFAGSLWFKRQAAKRASERWAWEQTRRYREEKSGQ